MRVSQLAEGWAQCPAGAALRGRGVPVRGAEPLHQPWPWWSRAGRARWGADISRVVGALTSESC